MQILVQKNETLRKYLSSVGVSVPNNISYLAAGNLTTESFGDSGGGGYTTIYYAGVYSLDLTSPKYEQKSYASEHTNFFLFWSTTSYNSSPFDVMILGNTVLLKK